MAETKNQNNIDQFNEYVAEVFACLYSSFPVPTLVSFEGLTGIKNGFTSGSDFVTLSDDEKQKQNVFEGTVNWLIDSKYIYSTRENPHASSSCDFLSMVLAPKALEALNKVPSSIEGKSNGSDSIGGELTKAVKEGAKDTAKDLVKSGLSSLAGMATTLI